MVLNASERDVLVRYIGFRVLTATGCIVAVAVLFLPTLATWFSDNPVRIVAWAFYVRSAARGEWRKDQYGELEALASLDSEWRARADR
jgi:hypothetical protein